MVFIFGYFEETFLFENKFLLTAFLQKQTRGGCVRPCSHDARVGTLEWELYPSKGVHVKQRDFHTATAVGKHIIIVFGGRSDRLAPIFSGYDIYDENFLLL